MARILNWSLPLAAVAACVGFAADLKSGLQPGDTSQSFHVMDVTGPSAGKKLCYR